MNHTHKMATIRTDTYGVTIEYTPKDGHVADIIADLEDEIVDKAVMKYHRDQQYGNKKGDMEEYTFAITETDPGVFHAFTSGVKAKDKLSTVTVLVMWTTSRM